ncbi:MAG: phosphoribosylanthranilate isomerase [Acetobacter sp.]|jgi:phosphoribosylanthranilate isomerase
MRASVQIKICGLTDEVGVDACIAGKADWIGFVFFDRSPRYVTGQRARELARRCSSTDGPECVGLFVDPSDDEIAHVLDHVTLDVLQLNSSVERAHEIRQRFGLPVWLACSVSSRADLPSHEGIDRFVLDARAPAHSDRPGGNGVAFDWSLTRGWSSPVPWLLAGGLNPGNVSDAIAVSGALAVDVSSGVESRPGIKDAEAIAAFIRAARGGEQ